MFPAILLVTSQTTERSEKNAREVEARGASHGIRHVYSYWSKPPEPEAGCRVVAVVVCSSWALGTCRPFSSRVLPASNSPGDGVVLASCAEKRRVESTSFSSGTEIGGRAANSDIQYEASEASVDALLDSRLTNTTQHKCSKWIWCAQLKLRHNCSQWVTHIIKKAVQKCCIQINKSAPGNSSSNYREVHLDKQVTLILAFKFSGETAIIFEELKARNSRDAVVHT